MRLDDEMLEELKIRIGIATHNVCLGFASLSDMLCEASISFEKCGEVLAKNARRFEEHESSSN